MKRTKPTNRMVDQGDSRHGYFGSRPIGIRPIGKKSGGGRKSVRVKAVR
jgi:hypothetical protein